MDFTLPEDIEKRKELEKLFSDWKEQIKTREKIVFKDDGKQYPAIAYFTTDGFYPGYFSKENKVKILFIGREPRYYSDQDRIKIDLDDFKNLNLNRYNYWRRIFYLLYGIKQNGKCIFSDVPCANEIAKMVLTDNNYSFANMNISKYCNEASNAEHADYKLIKRFLTDSELSKRNFIREEISLLEPNIILSAYLWNGKIDDELKKIFPESDFSPRKESNNKAVNMYDFYLDKSKKKKIKWLELYHFSAPCKKTDDDFYKPTMELLFTK